MMEHIWNWNFNYLMLQDQTGKWTKKTQKIIVAKYSVGTELNMKLVISCRNILK